MCYRWLDLTELGSCGIHGGALCNECSYPVTSRYDGVRYMQPLRICKVCTNHYEGYRLHDP